jgi:hypothetical protein
MHPVHQRGRVFAWEIASRPVPGVRTFTETTPSLEDFWRSIILLGRNVASYKFAPARLCWSSPTRTTRRSRLTSWLSRSLAIYAST